MKRMIKVIAVAAATLMPLSAAAQKNINNAVDAFGSNKAKYGIWKETNEKNPQGAYCNIYQFRLPKKEENKLDFVRKAFYQDASDAYDVFVKKANDKTRSYRSIAYGDNLEKRLWFGWPATKRGRNYLFMFVESKQDSDYRYVYGLEWYYDGKDVEGCVVKIYSKNPKKVKSSKSLSTQKLSGKKLTSIDAQNGSTTILHDREGRAMEMSPASSPSDPIQQFGNLRAAYKNSLRERNIRNTTLFTGLANSILDLCKKKGAQMSVAEKQLCVEGLKEMQQDTPDKFIKGIFDVAVGVLNNNAEK